MSQVNMSVYFHNPLRGTVVKQKEADCVHGFIMITCLYNLANCVVINVRTLHVDFVNAYMVLGWIKAVTYKYIKYIRTVVLWVMLHIIKIFSRCLCQIRFLNRRSHSKCPMIGNNMQVQKRFMQTELNSITLSARFKDTDSNKILDTSPVRGDIGNPWDAFHKHGSTLMPACISNHVHY